MVPGLRDAVGATNDGGKDSQVSVGLPELIVSAVFMIVFTPVVFFVGLAIYLTRSRRRQRKTGTEGY